MTATLELSGTWLDRLQAGALAGIEVRNSILFVDFAKNEGYVRVS